MVCPEGWLGGGAPELACLLLKVPTAAVCSGGVEATGPELTATVGSDGWVDASVGCGSAVGTGWSVAAATAAAEVAAGAAKDGAE